ncbi:ankyrin repeat-containing domain protein [Pyronema omphalodes]|nr:ankyrin repeat-containing domain protein [Pyronema omphalodes]
MAPELQSLCLTTRFNASYFRDRLNRLGFFHSWGNVLKGDPLWESQHCGAEEEKEVVIESGDIAAEDDHQLDNEAPSGGVPVVAYHKAYPAFGQDCQDSESDDEDDTEGLIRRGIVNNSGPLGQLGKGNPALWAIKNFRVDTLSSLLQSGLRADLRFSHPLPCPNPRHRTDEERSSCKARPHSLLTYAICCGYAQIVEVILKCYPVYPDISNQVNHCPINSEDDVGKLSPLHYALSHGRQNEILDLLFFCINPDVNFGGREPPLTWMLKLKSLQETEDNFMDAAKRLLDMDAALIFQGYGYETILHRAAFHKMAGFTELCLGIQQKRYEKGLEIQKEYNFIELATKNPQPGDYIPTPEELKLEKEIKYTLLKPHWKLSPAVLVNVQDDAGCTALHYAVLHLAPTGIFGPDSYEKKDCEEFASRFMLVDVLLRFGANANIRNVYGETPLHYAVCKCKEISDQFCVVNILRKGGAEIDEQDFEGVTPVEAARRNMEKGLGGGVCWGFGKAGGDVITNASGTLEASEGSKLQASEGSKLDLDKEATAEEMEPAAVEEEIQDEEKVYDEEEVYDDEKMYDEEEMHDEEEMYDEKKANYDDNIFEQMFKEEMEYNESKEAANEKIEQANKETQPAADEEMKHNGNENKNTEQKENEYAAQFLTNLFSELWTSDNYVDDVFK